MRLATMFKKIALTMKWQVRCPACDRVTDLAELEAKREAPLGMVKRSFGWCHSCRTLRLLIIEPAPIHAPD